jgi:hypothetical protein
MAQIPHADPGLDCPLHRLPVEQVCHKCPWWLQIRGKNANTGADIDNWGCAVGFLPMLLIENAQQTRGAAAATEDMRNSVSDIFEQTSAAMVAIAGNPTAKVIEHARDDHRG